MIHRLELTQVRVFLLRQIHKKFKKIENFHYFSKVINNNNFYNDMHAK